ncbi:ankyrin repeat-containing domain protein [Talaromyces proteolyticus]|uniref:Ankyrin repeat-containing domain protein n=1 Tax=Talaromyces proteolyticus TaxID=1131652 RepID=A0AAD4Q2N9_9EURO|nr:ankyrin repeat-containing domain protein [Talaromyces proteolyticus]KAH8703877.1 ankyrin repeat-containing domain protein [Talaromyces proteolyticus]
MKSSGFKWAVRHGDLLIIKQLLDYGGDITSLESGYPLLLAIKKGDVEVLKFLLTNASKNYMKRALAQPIDAKKTTVLHWAISLADVPCVKVLLEESVDVGITNQDLYRPLDYLFKRTRTGLFDHYAEIIRLFLDIHPAEVFKPLHGESPWDHPGRKTPLILAVRQRSLKLVNIIIKASLLLNKYRTSEFINEDGGYGAAALSFVCDASKWPCDQNGRDQVLAIAKTLLLHGADVNKEISSNGQRIYLPIYRSCFRPPSIDHPRQILNTIRLQHDIISLLIDNGADVKIRENFQGSSDYRFPCIRFLDTTEYYSIYVLDSGKLYLEPEDILQDTHTTLRFEEDAPNTMSPSYTLNAWSGELESEEEEKEEILRLLQATFKKLLKNMEVNDFSRYCGGNEITLLHRASVIPGIFGVHATQILLEKGAKIHEQDTYSRTPLEHAVEKNMNTISIPCYDAGRESKSG